MKSKNVIERLVERFVGPPVRVPTKEDRQKQIEREVRNVVIGVGGGFYTTRKELEELRKKNLEYDFRKSK